MDGPSVYQIDTVISDSFLISMRKNGYKKLVIQALFKQLIKNIRSFKSAEIICVTGKEKPQLMCFITDEARDNQFYSYLATTKVTHSTQPLLWLTEEEANKLIETYMKNILLFSSQKLKYLNINISISPQLQIELIINYNKSYNRGAEESAINIINSWNINPIHTITSKGKRQKIKIDFINFQGQKTQAQEEYNLDGNTDIDYIDEYTGIISPTSQWNITPDCINPEDIQHYITHIPSTKEYSNYKEERTQLPNSPGENTWTDLIQIGIIPIQEEYNANTFTTNQQFQPI